MISKLIKKNKDLFLNVFIIGSQNIALIPSMMKGYHVPRFCLILVIKTSWNLISNVISDSVSYHPVYFVGQMYIQE